MARRTKKYTETAPEESKIRKEPPAMTPEGEENQLINLAMKLAKKQLLDGTASSQTINHFLTLATEKTRLERQKLEAEIEEKHAKAAAYEAAAMSEDMYTKAIEAMKQYNGYYYPNEYDGEDPYD